MTRRTDLTAGASYLDSLDPSRHLGGEGFVLIPGRFEQSRAYFGASHLWPRATRLHFYIEYTTRDERARDRRSPRSTSPTCPERWRSSRASAATPTSRFSYSYTDTELETLEPDRAGAVALLGTGRRRARRLRASHRRRSPFHISGGALREQARGSRRPRTTTHPGSAPLEVARETEKLTLRLRYDHSLFAFGYGDTSIPSGVEGPLVRRRRAPRHRVGHRCRSSSSCFRTSGCASSSRYGCRARA